MRKNFKELVQNLLSQDEKGLNFFLEFFSGDINNGSSKLANDEIAYLEEQCNLQNNVNRSISINIRAHCKRIKKKYTEAINLYDQAINLGSSYAMCSRGYMHARGQGGAINYAQAIQLYEQASVLGNATGMNNLAYMYHSGQGCAVNYAQAIQLYEQAIALDNVSAMNNRAYMHYHGQGGDVNYAEVIRLYEQAIALGNASAMHNRAHMHQHGKGGSINYAEAAKLYRQAKLRNSNIDLKPFESLKNNMSKSSGDYNAVSYQWAATNKTLSHYLKEDSQRLVFFAQDNLLTANEKRDIIATFTPFYISYIKDNYEYMLSESEKALISVISNEHRELTAFLGECKKNHTCFSSPANPIFLRVILPLIVDKFEKEVGENRGLAWVVTVLLSQLKREEISDKNFNALTTLRGKLANAEDGRLFAILLAYSECMYPACQNSVIHDLNRQKRDIFSKSALTGQQIDNWLLDSDNLAKRKNEHEPLNFLSPPEEYEILRWINETPFSRLLDPVKDIRSSIVGPGINFANTMRNSIFRPKNTTDNDFNQSDETKEATRGSIIELK